ncbi:MAG: fumarate reductase subunit FrdD [Cardiobacteriaceae bacterium]|nr:fumarate reductase subunit FrdD [Cardiobacteriaceae bacterium]
MNEKILAPSKYWKRFNLQHIRHLRHFKPVYWGLFSVGGTIAALALAPIIIALSIALPFGWLGSSSDFYQSIHGFVANKFVYLVLAGIVFSMLWHGVHRFYYVLHDLHIHIGNRTRNFFYLVAIVAFVLTLYAGWF